MKRLLLTLTLVAATATNMFGQGRVAFNNYIANTSVTVGTATQGASGGNAGDFVGANYSVQLLWAPQGTYANINAFLAASLGSSAAIPFFGVTGSAAGGHGPAGDLAGWFEGNVVPEPVGTSMPAGTYTMVARAWFNTGFATFGTALAASRNTGYSPLFNFAAVASPAPPGNTPIGAFNVGVVPEPSTFALAGLGAAALLLFRRRK